MPCFRAETLTASAPLAAVLPGPVAAQAINPAPNTVTPPTLRPDIAPDAQGIALPPAEALSPPAGAEELRLIPGRVIVEGGFAKVTDEVSFLARSLEGRSISVTELYRVASAIEAAHSRVGFILARVSVPPQRLVRAEQTQLEGTEAVSAFVGGVTTVDEGVTLRSELTAPYALGQITLAPYLFAAGGVGGIARPTSVELSHRRAGGVGGGVRTAIVGGRVGLAVEFAHGVTNLPALARHDHVNFAASLRF